MTVDNKAKGTAPSVAQLEAETQKEIEQIMSEIDDLQREMDTEPTAALPEAAPVPAVPKAVAVQAAPAHPAEDDLMKEFHGSGGGDGPSMEEMLGELKDEEETKGKSILDTAIEADGVDTETAEAAQALAEADIEADEAPVQAVSAEFEDSFEEDLSEGREEDSGDNMEEMEFDAVEEVATDDGSGSDGGEGSLTLTLKGSMNLTLKYEQDGREVSVAFAGDALKIKLSDGTEFKLPFHRTPALKRAA